ncbi:hypothetical protein [Sporosarcina sp. YIM B06819]|uniref:hypothetical protein n=1 Tax=Sporosarcina sp. YIM B06819 TaxID=3081769 RepID=UPI00298D3E6C|nr:hypothetical protein [Sporosarcina sp. YIM B06819]
MVTITKQVEFFYRKGHSFPGEHLSFSGEFFVKVNGEYVSYEGFLIPIKIEFMAKHCEFKHFTIRMKDIWGFDILDLKTQLNLQITKDLLNNLEVDTVFQMIKEDIFDDVEESVNKSPNLCDMRYFFLPI